MAGIHTGAPTRPDCVRVVECTQKEGRGLFLLEKEVFLLEKGLFPEVQTSGLN